jgi:hypothetical protein
MTANSPRKRKTGVDQRHQRPGEHRGLHRSDGQHQNPREIQLILLPQEEQPQHIGESERKVGPADKTARKAVIAQAFIARHTQPKKRSVDHRENDRRTKQHSGIE